MEPDRVRTVIETLWQEVAPFVATLGAALQDGHVSPSEGIQLSMGALALAGKLIGVLQTLHGDELQTLRARLHQAVVTLAPGREH
jgi:hypothetical protein